MTVRTQTVKNPNVITREEIARQAKARKHHAVPEWYQKNFARRTDGKVYVLRRHRDRWDQQAKWRYPAEAFHSEDAYYAKDENGAVITDAETTAHNHKDRQLAPVIKHLIERYDRRPRRRERAHLPREALERLHMSLMARDTTLIEEGLARGLTRTDVLTGSVDGVNRHAQAMGKFEMALFRTADCELIFGSAVAVTIQDNADGRRFRLLALNGRLAVGWLLDAPREHGPSRIVELTRRVGEEVNAQLWRRSAVDGGGVGAGRETEINRLKAAEQKRENRRRRALGRSGQRPENGRIRPPRTGPIQSEEPRPQKGPRGSGTAKTQVTASLSAKPHGDGGTTGSRHAAKRSRSH